MSRVRTALRSRVVRVSAGASVLTLALLASQAGVAAAAIPIVVLSDRRLKRAIRSI